LSISFNSFKVRTLEGFRIHQEKINASNITLITDFAKKDIDTLLIDSFKPSILIDSLSSRSLKSI